MDSILGSLVVQYKADIANLTANSAIAREEMSGVGEASIGMGGMVASGALAAVGAIVGFAEASIPVAAKFQQSMLKVQAYAGLSKQATSDMGDAILSMAAKVGTKPTELADAIYPIVSSGYAASDALHILELSAETAAASGAKTSVVADMLTTSLKAMHAPASQATAYMDMFNKIVALGKGEVPAYGAVIGKLALAAGSAKVPFGDMGAALATLTTHGFPSVAQAANSLGNMFTQIGPKVDALAAHAKKLHLAFDESAFKTMNLSDKISYLSKITDGNQGSLLKLMGGSTLALKAFDALSGSAKDYAANLEGMNKSQGMTASVFATTSAGWNATTKRMQASFEDLQIKVGSALLPVITSLGNALIPVMNNFGKLITAVENGTSFFQQDSIGMDAFKAALAGVGIAVLAFAITQIPIMITALGAMAVAGWLAIAPLLPFILIGALVAGVIFGIIQAVKHWGEIAHWLQGIWKNVSGFIGGAFSALGTKAHEATTNIGGAFSNLGTSMHEKGKDIQQTMQNIGQGAVDAGKWMYAHNTYWKASVDGITAGVAKAKTWLSSEWTAITTWIGREWLKWSTLAQTYFALVQFVIEQKITSIVSSITAKWTQIHNWITDKWNALKGLAQFALNGVFFVFDSIWSRISSPLTTAGNNTKNWFTTLASDAVQWGANIIQGVINGIGSMFSQLGSAASNAAQTVKNFLGFHSPAKMGPGAELSVWGPNLVKGFASGIDNSVPILVASVNHLMQVGTYPIRPSAIGVAASVAPLLAGQSSSGGDHTTIVQIDSLEITRLVQKQADKLVKLKLGPKGRLA